MAGAEYCVNNQLNRDTNIITETDDEKLKKTEENGLTPAFSHKVEGQYVKDGVLYSALARPEAMDWIEEGFVFRPDDVLLAAYPKTGSTWLGMIIHLILNKEDLHQGDLRTDVQFLTSFMELIAVPGSKESEEFEGRKSPRMIRSHLQYRILKKALERTAKQAGSQPYIVVPIRNPKDTMVSFFHFYRMFSILGNFKGTWSDYFHMIVNDQIAYGSWFDYVLGWSTIQGNPKVSFVHYEDTIEDPKKTIRHFAKFLSRDITEEEVTKIAEMTNFKAMKSSKKTSMLGVEGFSDDISHFLRKGEPGDWKNYFTVSQNEYYDALYKTKMAECNLPIRFELNK